MPPINFSLSLGSPSAYVYADSSGTQCNNKNTFKKTEDVVGSVVKNNMESFKKLTK